MVTKDEKDEKCELHGVISNYCIDCGKLYCYRCEGEFGKCPECGGKKVFSSKYQIITRKMHT